MCVCVCTYYTKIKACLYLYKKWLTICLQNTRILSICQLLTYTTKISLNLKNQILIFMALFRDIEKKLMKKWWTICLYSTLHHFVQQYYWLILLKFSSTLNWNYQMLQTGDVYFLLRFFGNIER